MYSVKILLTPTRHPRSQSTAILTVRRIDSIPLLWLGHNWLSTAQNHYLNSPFNGERRIIMFSIVHLVIPWNLIQYLALH